jgi:hypothetical protein
MKDREQACFSADIFWTCNLHSSRSWFKVQVQIHRKHLQAATSDGPLRGLRPLSLADMNVRWAATGGQSCNQISLNGGGLLHVLGMPVGGDRFTACFLCCFQVLNNLSIIQVCWTPDSVREMKSDLIYKYWVLLIVEPRYPISN